MSLNTTDSQSGDLFNGIVTCGSDLLHYKINSLGNKSHLVSWGSFGHEAEFSFKVAGTVLQSKAHHECLNNRLIDVLSSEVYEESMKYQASRYTFHKSKVSVQNVLMNGSLGFVRFENSHSNELVYSRRSDQYLFRILTESGTIKGPLADGFSGRIMVMKSLYSKK